MTKANQDLATGTRALILERAIHLFARVGFAGVSMRDIARSVGTTPAALYYHFPDKETLYLETMRFAYAARAEAFSAALHQEGTPRQRLEAFITRLAEQMYENPDFRRLLQRERLDGDEHRLQLLAEQVFHDQFEEIAALTHEIAPGFDPHMLAFSITGLVTYHVETARLRRYLPGNRPEHDDPAVLAEHVIRIVFGSVENG